MMKKAMLAGAAALLVLGAALPARAHDFEPGYYYAIGTVQPLGYSIYMQGTHLLAGGSGSTLALLESSYYGLDKYVGAKVKVVGWTEHTVEGHGVIMDVVSLTVLAWPKASVPFKILDQGNASKYENGPVENRSFVIRNAATWEVFHQMHHPGDKVPTVDFSKHQVLGAFMGPKNTGGNSITIIAVGKSGTKLDVTTKQVTPPPMGMLAYLKDPVRPYCLATTLKTTGSVYIDGAKAKVWTRAGLLGAASTFLAVGHVTLPDGWDRDLVKIGVFKMNIAAKYAVWPGTFPTDVTKLGGGEFAAFPNHFWKLVPVTSSAPLTNDRYTVIVWYDKGNDNSTGGDAMAMSDSLVWDGKKWKTADGKGFPNGIGQFEFDLTGTP